MEAVVVLFHNNKKISSLNFASGPSQLSGQEFVLLLKR